MLRINNLLVSFCLLVFVLVFVRFFFFFNNSFHFLLQTFLRFLFLFFLFLRSDIRCNFLITNTPFLFFISFLFPSLFIFIFFRLLFLFLNLFIHRSLSLVNFFVNNSLFRQMLSYGIMRFFS